LDARDYGGERYFQRTFLKTNGLTISARTLLKSLAQRRYADGLRRIDGLNQIAAKHEGFYDKNPSRYARKVGRSWGEVGQDEI